MVKKIIESKVLVAMSGGVDSSVAAALLKKEGLDVVGVTMEIWDKGQGIEDEGKDPRNRCSSSAVLDAKRVAAMLEIPHYTLNLRGLFREKVINNFIDEYRKGRTPNPCVRCNEHLKFDALVKKADELGAQFIATGHYAKVKVKGKKSKIQYELFKGKDRQKDQSYVLYMLDQEKLGRVLFPLGALTKKEVRKIARALKLPVADKEESQEICFVPNDDYGAFIENAVGGASEEGPILDNSGKVVGKHRGLIHYTIGQRKGLGAFGGRKYVAGIDARRNSIIIGDKKDVFGTELMANKVSYVSGKPPAGELGVAAKIRYNAKEARAAVLPQGSGRARVVFEDPQSAITPGQSVVFYSGDKVLGGGTIEEKIL